MNCFSSVEKNLQLTSADRDLTSLTDNSMSIFLMRGTPGWVPAVVSGTGSRVFPLVMSVDITCAQHDAPHVYDKVLMENNYSYCYPVSGVSCVVPNFYESPDKVLLLGQ